jgi:hypothetical protein
MRLSGCCYWNLSSAISPAIRNLCYLDANPLLIRYTLFSTLAGISWRVALAARSWVRCKQRRGPSSRPPRCEAWDARIHWRMASELDRPSPSKKARRRSVLAGPYSSRKLVPLLLIVIEFLIHGGEAQIRRPQLGFVLAGAERARGDPRLLRRRPGLHRLPRRRLQEQAPLCARHRRVLIRLHSIFP